MTLRERLDKLAAAGCGDPQCQECAKPMTGAPCYLHSSCHPEVPHLIYHSFGAISVECLRTDCMKTILSFQSRRTQLLLASWTIIATHGKDELLHLTNQCHPDTPLWCSYQHGSGVITAHCAQCQQPLARFTID